MLDQVFNSITTEENLSHNVSSTIICIIVALVLGILISISYLLSTPKRERSASFLMSMIILPAIVSVVILLIGGNVARAFSMVGIFTLVRFRSLPGDSKDISFVFLAMAVGLAVGLGYLSLGAVVAVIIGAAIVIIIKLGFGVSKQKEKRLKLMVPEDMNYEGAFDDLFGKYTDYYTLQKVRTTNMGTLFEINYDLIMKKDVSEKGFIDELRCRNGNLNIQIGVKDSNKDQL